VPKYAAQPGESHVSRAIPGVVHIDHMTALCADEKVVFSKHDLKTVPFVAVWATTFFSPKPREQSLDPYAVRADDKGWLGTWRTIVSPVGAEGKGCFSREVRDLQNGVCVGHHRRMYTVHNFLSAKEREDERATIAVCNCDYPRCDLLGTQQD